MQPIDPDRQHDQAVQIVLGQLDRLDRAIEKEYTLVSDRMTWMVISEAFIFGAFATAVLGYDGPGALKQLAVAIAVVLPILGFLIAVLARLAIIAANTAANRLKKRRKEMQAYFNGDFRVDLIGVEAPTHFSGNTPAAYLPPIFATTWLGLFVAVTVILMDDNGREIVTAVISAAVALVVAIMFGKRARSQEKRA